MKHPLFLSYLLWPLLAVLCSACNVVNGGNLPPPPEQNTSGITGGSSCSGGRCWWSDTEGANCQSAGVPGPSDRPSVDDAPGTTLEPFFLGISQVWSGESTPNSAEDTAEALPWESFGYDLDGVCTNSRDCTNGASDSPELGCKPATSEVPYDGLGCRDNTFSRFMPIVSLVPELGQVLGLTEEALNCSFHNGAYNLLIRIANYNGEANDPQVSVDVYISTGMVDQRIWACPMEDFREKYPLWRKSDKFYIADLSLADPDAVQTTASAEASTTALPDSRYRTDQAFVRDGYLVANMDVSVHLAGENAAYVGWRMFLEQGVITGKLHQELTRNWELHDGLVGGRLGSENLMRSFRELGVCPAGKQAALYSDIEEYVWEGNDLLLDGSTNPDEPCDAFSVALAFEASQASPGPIAHLADPIDCCETEENDSANCKLGCGDGQVIGLELCDTGIPQDAQGACPLYCENRDACHPALLEGTGCQQQCIEYAITAPQNDDGCCPSGFGPNDDNDCEPSCGDGIIERPEICDPPEQCPTAETCLPTDACNLAELVGEPAECRSLCVQVPISTCTSGDGCCPTECTYQNDDDCSNPALCGNGDLDTGETCDATDCPTTCDDGDVCTADIARGSAATCNLRCENTAITQCVNNDGCCPEGCTAQGDNNCTPECGNGVREGDEACDDGNDLSLDGCSNCEIETPEAQCLAVVADKSTADCSACNCVACTDQMLSCLLNPDESYRERCGAVLACAISSGCSGTECFCGDRNEVLCAFLGPNGPCANEIAAAAETTDPVLVSTRQYDPRYPLATALAVGDCTEQNCAAACF